MTSPALAARLAWKTHRDRARSRLTTGAGSAFGAAASAGAATVTGSTALARLEPLHEAVCPVKTNVVEQPSPSLSVSRALYVPGAA